LKETDRKIFYQTWAAAWEQCGKDISETQIRFAFEALVNYSLEDVQRGVMAHSRNPETGQFPPKAADVVRQIEGDPNERAAKAWQRVVNAIQSHGPYKKLVFDDAAIHAALDGGMWANLCSCESYHDLNFRQKEFEVCYKAGIGGANYPGVICAIPQDDNKIYYIGDEQKARHVLEFASQRELYGPQHISGYLA
jgi:hypothetical protein